MNNLIKRIQKDEKVYKLVKGVEIGAIVVILLVFMLDFTMPELLGRALGNLLNLIAIIIAVITGCLLDGAEHGKLRPAVLIASAVLVAVVMLFGTI